MCKYGGKVRDISHPYVTYILEYIYLLCITAVFLAVKCVFAIDNLLNNKTIIFVSLAEYRRDFA